MPTRKVRDFKPSEHCNHPEHNPPSMEVFSPGVYEHACPLCKRVVTFIVPSKPALRVCEVLR